MNTTVRTVETVTIATDGRINDLTLAGPDIGKQISASIGCRCFDVVSLTDDIDLFVDDEGLINGSNLNMCATVIAHVLGTKAVIFGQAVVTKATADGETVSLTPTQRATITAALRQKPDAATVDALAASLAPFPGIVAMLRH